MLEQELPSDVPYALTSPQLVMQAVSKNYGAASLLQLRRGHDAAQRLFDGFYRAQDTPFIVHLIRTASITMAQGGSVDEVIVALLHAVYDNGVFRDGQLGGTTAGHRKEIAAAVGERVEAGIFAYTNLSFDDPATLQTLRDGHAALRVEERATIFVALANELEDYLDLQMVFRRTSGYQRVIEKKGALVVGLARDLGHGPLADQIDAAYQQSLQAALPDAVKTDRSGAYELPEHLRLRKGGAASFFANVKRRLLANFGPENPLRAFLWRVWKGGG